MEEKTEEKKDATKPQPKTRCLDSILRDLGLDRRYLTEKEPGIIPVHKGGSWTR